MTRPGKRSFAPIYLSAAILVVLLAINAALQRNFFSYFNISSTFRAFMPLVLIALGQTVVIQGGAIDLSVGSQVSLFNVVLVSMLEPVSGSGGGTALVLVLGFLIAVGAGLVNGIIVAKGRLQPILATFATGTVYGGIALWIMPVPGGTVSSAWYGFYSGRFVGIPTAAWILIVLLLLLLWFQRTRVFSHIRAVGGNRLGAFQTGLAVDRIHMASYVGLSVLTFVASLLIVADTGSGNPLLGPSYALDSITAVIIGGVPIVGGSGSIFGGVVGAFILNYINNVVFFARVPVVYQRLLQATVVVIALGAGGLLTRGRKS